MMAFGFDVDQTIADLQAISVKWPEYEGLELKLARLKADLVSTQEELGQVKAKLQVAQSSLARQRAQNQQQHNTELQRMSAELRELQIAIGKANGANDALAVELRDKGVLYADVVSAMNALMDRLNS